MKVVMSLDQGYKYDMNLVQVPDLNDLMAINS
jgi:hypothetical protein